MKGRKSQVRLAKRITSYEAGLNGKQGYKKPGSNKK